MTTHDLAIEMDRLLAEARGFVRGSDLFGARAQFDKSELDKQASQASPDPAVAALRARVELELHALSKALAGHLRATMPFRSTDWAAFAQGFIDVEGELVPPF